MLKNNPIIKHITLFSLPYIFLYSLYIQLNGEVSPGGGFQAGVIFASSLIGYDLIYGHDKIKKYFSIDALIYISALGVVIYALVGVISLLFGDNFLNYYSFALFTKDKIAAQHMAIFIIEIGIGLSVAAVMYLIYNLLSTN